MIHPQLTQALAQANVDDLRRAALARARALPCAHPARAVRGRLRRSASNPNRTLSIAISGTVLVLAVFSAFVVTVSDAGRSLHAGVADEAWMLSGMSLGLATALLTAGALADDVGHRRVLIWSAGLLAGASALAATTPDVAVLVAARVLQGVAGGGVLAASLGSIGRAFPTGPARTRATGVWGAAVGGGIAVGPLAGAGLGAALGWRCGFWFEAAGAPPAGSLGRGSARCRLGSAHRSPRRGPPQLDRHHHAGAVRSSRASARGIRRGRVRPATSDARPALVRTAPILGVDHRRAVHR